MYIEIIKDHSAGLKKGQCFKVDASNGRNLVKEKIAKEITEAQYSEWLSGYYGEKQKDADKFMGSDKDQNEKAGLIKQIEELDLDGLKDYVENRGLEVELPDGIDIEEASEMVINAESFSKKKE